MPLYQPKVPVRVAIGLSAVALVCQFVAVVGTGWLMSDGEGIGLFCTKNSCLSEDGWLKACQAFSLLALLTIPVSLVLGVVHIFKEDPQKLILPARLCSLAVAGFVAVEVGVFLGHTIGPFIIVNSQIFYGYGFFLSIVAGILMFVTAILHKP